MDEIQQTSDAIGESKKKLEKVLVSTEDEEMYAEMVKRTNKELEELAEEKTKKRLHIAEEDKEIKEGKSQWESQEEGIKE